MTVVQNLLSVWVTSTAEAVLGEMFWPPERSSVALPWREATGTGQTPQLSPIRVPCTGIENA